MRFPKYAETTFERACSSANAYAHPPEEDQNGWDYMVEFADRKHSGPPDLHPPGSKAFVQIKSSSGQRLTCRVKLSNALKAAQSRDPWFVVLMIANAAPQEPLIYAVHVWQELMEQTLRAVRLADQTGIALHRRTLTISFKHTDLKTQIDLVPWMQSTIDAVGADYSLRKKNIHESVGFDDGYAVGHMSFSVNNEEEIYDNFLGLGDGMQLSSLSLTPIRFGIPDKKNAFEHREGTVHITPSAAGDCEIRVRGSTPGRMISLPAKVYVLGEPIVSADKRRLRFSGHGVEIVWSNDGFSKFNLNVHFGQKQTLLDLENIATLMNWAALGVIDLQVWTANGRAIGGTLDSTTTAPPQFDWSKLIDVVSTLRSLAGNASSSNIELALSEIHRSTNELYFLHQIVGAPSLMMEFIPLLELPENAREVLYYVSAEVGDLVAYAIVERPLRKFEDIEGGRKRLVFGTPVIRENWIAPIASSHPQRMIKDDYQRALNTVRASGAIPLELGDIRQLYDQGQLERQAGRGEQLA